ncbi:MAG: prolipoprotein diacylglyceryl transferase [Bacteroidota bacterium]
MQLLHTLGEIVWTADPTAFSIGDFDIRWYGIAYFTMFLVGYFMMKNIYEQEGKTEKQLDKLIFYMMGAVIIGGRLGHVLFYAPEYYLTSEHWLEIFALRDGGMASHGATFAIFLVLVWYSKKEKDISLLWVTDRLLIAIALGAMLIRLGNLMNHEIVGHPTDVSWGFVFMRRVSDLGMEPRHPAQLYEAIAYFILFIGMIWAYFVRGFRKPQGLLTGVFVTYLFTARFFIEYTKLEQSHYENNTLFSVGQWLSFPLIAIGIYLIVASLQGKYQPPEDSQPGETQTADAS